MTCSMNLKNKKQGGVKIKNTIPQVVTTVNQGNIAAKRNFLQFFKLKMMRHG